MRFIKFCFTTLVIGLVASSNCIAGAASTSEDTGRIRAQLVSQHDVLISSQVEGKIAQLPFKDGDAFKRGDLLIEFDCELYEAQLQKAEASADAASKTYDVNKQLNALHSVGEIEVEQAKARAKETSAESAYVRATVDHCRIVAPFAGRVAKRIAAQYEYVSAGKPLLQIVDDRNLELKLIVPSGWLAWLRVGTLVQVHMDDLNADYTASVVRLGARIDPVSQTLEITAQIKGIHSELLPGMSGWVRFPERK